MTTTLEKTLIALTLAGSAGLAAAQSCPGCTPIGGLGPNTNVNQNNNVVNGGSSGKIGVGLMLGGTAGMSVAPVSRCQKSTSTSYPIIGGGKSQVTNDKECWAEQDERDAEKQGCDAAQVNYQAAIQTGNGVLMHAAITSVAAACKKSFLASGIDAARQAKAACTKTGQDIDILGDCVGPKVDPAETERLRKANAALQAQAAQAATCQQALAEIKQILATAKTVSACTGDWIKTTVQNPGQCQPQSQSHCTKRDMVKQIPVSQLRALGIN